MIRKKKTAEEEKVLELPDEYILIAADLSLNRPGFCRMHIKHLQDGININDIALTCNDNKTRKTDKPRGQILEEIFCCFRNFACADPVKPVVPIYLVREKSVNNYGGNQRRRGSAATSGISEVVGVMDYAAWLALESEWEEIYPVSIKKLLTDDGHADKQKVADSLVGYVGELPYANDDESDATAVAVAWLIKHNQIKSIVKEDRTE